MLDELARVFFFFSFFSKNHHRYYRVSLQWRHLFCRGWWRDESHCLGLYSRAVLCSGSCEEFVSLCCVFHPLPAPHTRTQWVEEESRGVSSLAAGGAIKSRLCIESFSLTAPVADESATRKRRRRTQLSASITLKQQQLCESFCPNQFCNLRDRGWLIERSPVFSLCCLNRNIFVSTSVRH